MNAALPVTFRIGESDHFALWELMTRRSGIAGLGKSVPVVVALGVVIGLFKQSVLDAVIPVGVGLFAGLAFFALFFATLKGRARKVYRESVTLHEVMTLTFHADGFEIEQTSGRLRARWADMVRWDENPAIMAVFLNRQSAIAFPKQQLSGDIVDRIREQMQRSGLPKPWSLRK